LKKEFSQVKSLASTFTPTPAPCTSGPGTNKFEQWHLEKINNEEEFNMIVKDGKKYYWCNKHKYPTSDVQGMYVFHKPTEHESWLTTSKISMNDVMVKEARIKQQLPL
jgi:hypothetical protein